MRTCPALAAVLLTSITLAAAAAGPVPGRPLLRPAERSAILEALAEIGLDERDLEFNKDYVNRDGVARDRWRVPDADRLLAHPLEAPVVAGEIADELAAAAPSPARFVTVAASRIGVALAPPRGRAEEPLEVVLARAMAGRPAVEVDAARAAAGRLPGPAARALSLLLGAALAADLDIGAALPALGRDGGAELAAFLKTLEFDREDGLSEAEERRRAERLLAQWDGCDPARLLAAARDLFAAAEAARDALTAPAAASPDASFSAETVLGRVVVTGRDRDAIDLEAAIVLDLGGDDVYRPGPGPAAPGRVRVILDLGGDDFYDGRGRDGSVGGAIGGVSLLIDEAGDDVYRGGRVSLGSAAFGAAALVDLAGDDLRSSDAHSQGAASFGVAWLYDAAGADTYRAAAYAQGFAGVKGLGLLHDARGFDSYYAGGRYLDNPGRFAGNSLSCSQGFAIGMRPLAGGGIGVLLDDEGNDQYWSEVYGQGSSYWFALGLLRDGGGDDTYAALQYAQGSGIHLSTALLVDEEGNDGYLCGHLGQGSSHDLSVGFLIDHAGNDTYAGMSTLQGGALTNSATFFLDGGGDDSYLAHELQTSRGTASEARGWGGVGVFLDLGGRDVYNASGRGSKGEPQAHGMEDDVVRIAGEIGVSVDRDSGAPAALPASPPAPEPAPAPVALAPRADLAARLGRSVAWSNPRPVADAERAALIAEGPSILPGLLALLDRELLLEQYAVQDVVLGIARAPGATEAVRAEVGRHLLAHLRARRKSSYEGLRWVLKWVGDLKVDPERSAAAVAALAGDPHARVRAGVAEALAALGRDGQPPVLERLLADRDEVVRAVAARALAGVAGERAIPALARALADPALAPRRNAARALVVVADRSEAAAAAVRAAVAPLSSASDRRVSWLVSDLLARLGAKH